MSHVNSPSPAAPKTTTPASPSNQNNVSMTNPANGQATPQACPGAKNAGAGLRNTTFAGKVLASKAAHSKLAQGNHVSRDPAKNASDEPAPQNPAQGVDMAPVKAQSAPAAVATAVEVSAAAKPLVLQLLLPAAAAAPGTAAAPGGGVASTSIQSNIDKSSAKAQSTPAKAQSAPAKLKMRRRQWQQQLEYRRRPALGTQLLLLQLLLMVVVQLLLLMVLMTKATMLPNRQLQRIPEHRPSSHPKCSRKLYHSAISGVGRAS